MRSGVLSFPKTLELEGRVARLGGKSAPNLATLLEGSVRTFSQGWPSAAVCDEVDRSRRWKAFTLDINTIGNVYEALKSERGNWSNVRIISSRLTCYLYYARHENRAVSNAHGSKRCLIQESAQIVGYGYIYIFIYHLFSDIQCPCFPSSPPTQKT